MSDLINPSVHAHMLQRDNNLVALLSVLKKIADAKIHLSDGIDVRFANDAVYISIHHPWYMDEPKDWHTDKTPAAARREELRQLKKIFGHFKAEGSAPYVALVSRQQIQSKNLYVEILGVFKCEVKETKDVQLSPEEIRSRRAIAEQAAQRALETTRQEKVYSCEADPALIAGFAQIEE